VGKINAEETVWFWLSHKKISVDFYIEIESGGAEGCVAVAVCECEPQHNSEEMNWAIGSERMVES